MHLVRRDPAAVDLNGKKDKHFKRRKSTGFRCFSFFTIFTMKGY
nr:MAG TPA: hypothetical protein [Caudoviricetes sp.]